jgi:ElaB/YqjD/DUF883 family membrane-anchored ribosome-binding protein
LETLTMPTADSTFEPANNDQAGLVALDAEDDAVVAETSNRSLRERLAGLKNPARAKAQAIYDRVKAKTAAPRSKADTLIRQKPYAALGAALLAGAVLSRLMRRR